MFFYGLKSTAVAWKLVHYPSGRSKVVFKYWSFKILSIHQHRFFANSKLTREEKILQKNQLVADFNNLKTSLTEAVGRGDPQEIQSLVNQLNDNIWPTLVDVSLDLIGTDVCVWEDEEQFQRQLRHTMAHLLYLAGYKLAFLTLLLPRSLYTISPTA